MTDQATPTILKAGEVASLLRVHVDKVYAMAQSGELPQLRRVGPELRFSRAEIDAWLHEREVPQS